MATLASCVTKEKREEGGWADSPEVERGRNVREKVTRVLGEEMGGEEPLPDSERRK